MKINNDLYFNVGADEYRFRMVKGWFTPKITVIERKIIVTEYFNDYIDIVGHEKVVWIPVDLNSIDRNILVKVLENYLHPFE